MVTIPTSQLFEDFLPSNLLLNKAFLTIAHFLTEKGRCASWIACDLTVTRAETEQGSNA